MKDPNDFMTGKGEPAWSLPMNRTELIARAEALEAALQLRCPQCDMRLLERTALETLVDLKDPHNAHHPDRLKGPGLTAPETGTEPVKWIPCWCPYCGEPHSPAVRETKDG